MQVVSRVKSEAGTATLLMVSVLAGVMVLIGAVAIVVDIAHTRSKAGTAADLAALAGATEVLLGDPCGKAERVARANDSTLETCSVEGEDVQVTIQTKMGGALRAVTRGVRIDAPKVSAVSRAGPPQCDQTLKALGILC